MKTISLKTTFQTTVLLLLASLFLLPGTARAQDADADGMPDSWEAVNVCLNPAVNAAAVDHDADGLTSPGSASTGKLAS